MFANCTFYNHCGVHGHWVRKCPINNLLKQNEDLKKEDVGQTKAQGHVFVAPISSNNVDEELEPFAHAYMAIIDEFPSDGNSQYVDSGASQHMTYHRHWLTTFEPMAIGRMKVHVVGDQIVWVEGYGDV